MKTLGRLLLVAASMAWVAPPIEAVKQSEPTAEPQVVNNEVLIKLRVSAKGRLKASPRPDDTGIASLDALNKKHGVSQFKQVAHEGERSLPDHKLLRWYKVTLPGQKSWVKASSSEFAQFKKNVLDDYAADPDIEHAEPNHEVRLLAVPNDPHYGSSGSWGQSFPDLWGLKKIGMEPAWDQTTGSSAIVVAVIDTGVDYNHVDIKANMWVNQAEIPNNGLDDDRNGKVDDYRGWDWVSNDNDPWDDHGHGTHVSGTIGAVGNNGLGVVGVNWKVKIMPLKFLGVNGGTTEGGIEALQYAADMGARLSSNSWGCQCHSQALDDAVQYEHDRGMSMFAAAGNSDMDATFFSPASADRAVTVAASDPDDRKADFSNWGEKIDVAAPGVDIYSLQASGDPATPGSQYFPLSGTSMAAPHVSGLAALLLSKNPALTNEELRQILRRGATDLGTAGKDPSFGYGRINAAGSMALAATKPLTPIITSPGSRSIVLTGAALEVRGGVRGPNFASYKIEYGAGIAPASWTTLVNSSVQVLDGVLASANIASWPEGRYAFRLTATDTSGKTYQFQVHNVNVQKVDDPPSVAITAPRDGESVAQSIVVTVTAADDIGLSHVEVYKDGVLSSSLPAGDTAYSKNYSLDTYKLANGAHTLTAKSYDSGGQSASHTITINVNNLPDTLAPGVAFTKPASGATIVGTVEVLVNAWDDRGISKVEFYKDGALFGSDDTSPYSFQWNTALDPAGLHTLRAKAYDLAGNAAETTISVTSVIDATPPTVSINTPSDGASVAAAISIGASASDTHGVSKVELYRDGALLSSDGSSPYIFSWDTSLDSVGPHSLTARAYDTSGNTADKTITVNVVRDVTPPTVRITSPGDGSVVAGTTTVQISASDNIRLSRTELYKDGVILSPDVMGNYKWNASLETAGLHTLTAKAYDTSGNEGSHSVVVNVVTDVQPPTATILSPADGAVASGTVSVLIHGVDAVSVAKIEFLVDGALKSWSFPSSADTKGSFSWNTLTETNSAHALTGKVYDTSGNVASHSINVTVNNGGDATAPTVALTAPANGATVAGTVSITASASDNARVDKVEFYRGTTLLGSDTASPYSYSWNTTLEANAAYTLTAKAYDAAGNTASSSVNVTVNNPDTTRPSVGILSPRDGANVKSPVAVAVSGSDNRGVQKVELWADGALVATKAFSPATPSFDTSFSWSTTVKGQHTLTARAYDVAGNMGSSGLVRVNIAGKTRLVSIVRSGPEIGSAESEEPRALLVSLQHGQTQSLLFDETVQEARIFDAKGRVWTQQTRQGGPLVIALQGSSSAGLPLESGLWLIQIKNDANKVSVAPLAVVK